MRKILKSFQKRTKSNVLKMRTDQIDKSIILKKSLKENIEIIKKTLGNSSDLEIKKFYAGKKKELKLAVIFTDGLVKKELIYDVILNTLMIELKKIDFNSKDFSNRNLIDTLQSSFIPSLEDMQIIKDFKNLYLKILSGDTVLLIDGYASALVTDTKGWEDRGVTESSAESVVRGPKDSFTETLRTNTSLLRRRIKSTDLWIEEMTIGEKTNTSIAIAYMKGIASENVIKEVYTRLNRIDIDAVLESGYIEELIQDDCFTIFPTIYHTERPDSVAANLLEGRIAIFVDGTPFVLIVPALFVQFFQSPEDYYQRADIGSLIRILRYVAFFLSMLTPSLYIALTTFHQQMLPPPFLISIIAQREAIPFPAFMEAIFMEFTFEILREAGVRMPRAIGPTISIVGALVLGEAAVDAGIVSPVMVIVVSITAISSFVFPAYNMAIAIRIIRFVFMILAATFGFFGIALGLLAMTLHLCSLRSFGVSYMSPIMPINFSEQKDTLVRFPLWSFLKRPQSIVKRNRIRQQSPSNARPKKPNNK
ncbi:spore germination protein [Garciella nitratireducens]|uniref:Spore germination protein KA n=1 Tax=Garciella nitratireducens DSM 15102 TaxID=1121911 RepID=A0A1T4JSF2_9FIRM|nr:spore germination protein [Garciella nitratireducens]SJZ33071.1 spore germination protein KA [Garciella nitratireducens DSM 15102]